MPNSNDLKVNQNLVEEFNEIDLSLFFAFFVRNKKIIALTSIATFLVSICLTFFVKKVWTGQFEIVLNNNQNNINLPDFAQFSKFINNTEPNNLKTEVGILESPSILLPIFEFVNKKKTSENQSLIYNQFQYWKKNNLKINLKNNTSILQISYFDNQKELIVPVLEKISTKYQDYSNRSRQRANVLTKLFLENQIKVFRNKSALSFKAAQSFAIDQDLDNLNFYLNNDIETDNQIIMPNISIEKVRIDAANRIRDIDARLKQIQKLGDNSEQIQYIGSNIPAIVREELIETLEELEIKLDTAKSTYRDNDLKVKQLINERNRLINLIRKRIIGYLNAEKLSNKALMESAMRPKDVLLNYKSLIREAKRDESTLINLENQLRIIEIDESRLKDPWELITIPTLMQNAVYPSKKIFGMFGLFIGSILGASLAYYKEKKTNLIFERKILDRKLSIPTTEEIYINQITKNSNNIEYLRKFMNFEDNQLTSLMPLGFIEEDSLKLLQKYLINKEIDKKSNLKIYLNNLNEFLKSKNKFLVANMKNIRYCDISSLINYLAISDLGIKGIIIINEGIPKNKKT